MKSGLRGASTSGVEVTAIAADGFWLSLDGRELFVSFAEFPWFEGASAEAVSRIERPQPHHLRWPAIDVDLSVASIERPERYPLKARV
jgi:Protein of unknown function (DUF2442)